MFRYLRGIFWIQIECLMFAGETSKKRGNLSKSDNIKWKFKFDLAKPKKCYRNADATICAGAYSQVLIIRTGHIIRTGWFFSWLNQLWVLDDLNKNPLYWFFYYYTTLPIIRTVWKISLHLQIYVLVDLKNMGRKIYKTSTYNRNLREHA